MTIYAIPGLGADYRVFDYLKLDHKVIVLQWLTPTWKESISEYALRLSTQMDTRTPFVLLGVSFGGLVAAELAKHTQPEKVILISSVSVRAQLPVFYQLLGRLRVMQFIPVKRFMLNPRLTARLFGTQRVNLLRAILKDTNPKLVRWSLKEIFTWENTKRPSNCLVIGGSKDKLFPPKLKNGITLIDGGQHFMIVDRADELSEIINRWLSTN